MITTILPLGLGVLLSPEILMLGLWLAGSKKEPLLKAWFFCIGGVVGLALLMTVGYFLHIAFVGPSWTKFYIRAGLGTILFCTALHLFFKGEKDPKKIEQSRFAGNAGPMTAAGLGFLVTGLNLKVASFAVTAGHQVAMFSGPPVARAAGLALFFGLGFLPLVLPAALETMKPGIVNATLVPVNRLLEKYGRWIGIAICIFMGGLLWKHALAVLP